ncbi:nitrate reductase cytochrome c-type subunit [Pseudorhizobium marinum]|uniref:nitrate reductase cytochrome c-type subunit n=1 Tax=Pseudorhizobium marinum TaxID=1496690 RepID=UPI00056949B2|nr:nitrate reductase cytochrome c-type subunit [Pseudorhizobium marinum]MBU1313753.1 nitrate reductase cytochrome c-type subunit [Alphaproteobacteria bacterium]MDY6961860.1 nitrate reductase cytochrome c-type subunit [Pseudomonadota bacterium]MBU1548619.1 nitrate reductase cytochrome c-type subunit [Alphaproteobacteria bacterium]MBU2334419.1 nitrate reductase cytochrome c-type subunit [Alphaproteobacteria bacterium]MBU2388483.1 nitrate reductase cytochrome c-type subunit [Alphaproteobacteria b
MRSQNRSRRLGRGPIGLAAVCATLFITTIVVAQTVPQLSGPTEKMESVPAKPMPKWIVDDVRKMRAYPDQPPVIPHSIEGYQLSVNTNRCLSCHKREFTESSGAPMISVTHYMTREGQMLADVSPRRYFCTACHVPQADVNPLVENTFRDMSEMGVEHIGEQEH